VANHPTPTDLILTSYVIIRRLEIHCKIQGVCRLAHSCLGHRFILAAGAKVRRKGIPHLSKTLQSPSKTLWPGSIPVQIIYLPAKSSSGASHPTKRVRYIADKDTNTYTITDAPQYYYHHAAARVVRLSKSGNCKTCPPIRRRHISGHAFRRGVRWPDCGRRYHANHKRARSKFPNA